MSVQGLYVLPSNVYVPCEAAMIIRFNLQPGQTAEGFAFSFQVPTSPRFVTDVRLASGDNSQFHVYKIAVDDPPPSSFNYQASLETDLPALLTPVGLSCVRTGNITLIRIQAAALTTRFSMDVLR